MRGLTFAQAQASYDAQTPPEPEYVSQAWWDAECRERAPKYLEDPAWVLDVLNGNDIRELADPILAELAQATASGDQTEMGRKWQAAIQQVAEWSAGQELESEGYSL